MGTAVASRVPPVDGGDRGDEREAEAEAVVPGAVIKAGEPEQQPFDLIGRMTPPVLTTCSDDMPLSDVVDTATVPPTTRRSPASSTASRTPTHRHHVKINNGGRPARADEGQGGWAGRPALAGGMSERAAEEVWSTFRAPDRGACWVRPAPGTPAWRW